jgi:L-threonylcarbamoyladenylate synthase
MTAATLPRLEPVDPRDPGPAAIALAVDVLRAGRLVAFPTETFYGLGADALDPEAVARVFRAKGRPADKPLLVLVDSLEMARTIVSELPIGIKPLLDAHWPGPLTVVFHAQPHVPHALTAGTGTVGVRLPGHAVARALVRGFGRPVTAPSANPHARPSPTTATAVRRWLGDSVDLVLDGGPTPGGYPSTVLDATVRPYRVVRAGAVVLGPAELGEPGQR